MKPELILAQSYHRPFPVPEGNWKYYQEWHNVVFAHWRVPVNAIEGLLPGGLEADLFEGEAWISLAAFTVKKLHPRFVPSISSFSDFHEINIRTYVLHGNHPGIYFLSLEASKKISALMGRIGVLLNYYKSTILHGDGYFISVNNKRNFHLNLQFHPIEGIIAKEPLERWLVERYTLFHELFGKIFRNEIHHREWPLQQVKIESFEADYRFSNLIVNKPAELWHYSTGVDVLTWGKRKG